MVKIRVQLPGFRFEVPAGTQTSHFQFMFSLDGVLYQMQKMPSPDLQSIEALKTVYLDGIRKSSPSHLVLREALEEQTMVAHRPVLVLWMHLYNRSTHDTARQQWIVFVEGGATYYVSATYVDMARAHGVHAILRSVVQSMTTV